MKRNIFMAAFAAFGALFLNSCNQELDDMTPVVDESGMVTITAAFPELVESKVDFAEQGDGSGLDLTWEEEDYLTVVSGSVSEKYAIASINGKVATFTGAPVNGETFDVILSRSGDYAARTYAGQTQATVASTDHLLYDAVLKGVDTYENVSFTAEWAAEHDGTFAQNGCLMLNFKMPEDAGYLKTVTLTAPEAVFYTTNATDGEKTKTLTLSLADADMASDNVVEAYIMTSMQEASVAAETELTLTVVSNLGTWSKKFTPGAFTLKAGMRNVITLNDKDWTVPAGDGSQAAPYIIRTVEDMNAISGRLDAEGNVKKYFAVVNDIDMTTAGVWTAPSQAEPYPPIDFNGNDRTISKLSVTNDNKYAGLIGVLNGNLYDLTLTSVYVSGGSKVCGFACGYCGSGDVQGHIENVHVQGTFDIGSTGGVGGIAGQIGNGTIRRCSAVLNGKDGKVPGQKIGGIAGAHNDASNSSVCEISDCFAMGSVDATGYNNAQKVGGIIGSLHDSGKATSIVALVHNCYSTLDIITNRNAGGIVGCAWNCNGASTVENSIAWNETITNRGTTTAGANYVSGTIVGSTRNKQTLANCIRRADMSFSCYVTETDGGFDIIPYEQDNTSPDSKVPYAGPDNTSYDYCYVYHGKAAAPGETVSDVAKRLGWDETIWDLSGDYPQLIK